MPTKLTFLLLLLVFPDIFIFSQGKNAIQKKPDTISKPEIQVGVNPDSAQLSKRVDSVRRIAIRSDTSLVRQLNLMEEFADRLSQMSVYFNRGIDTLEISEEIGPLEHQVQLARESMAENPSSSNLRNTTATKILLTEMGDQLEKWQDQMSGYSQQLVTMRSLLDSMTRDSTIRIIPQDSMLAQQYLGRVVDLVKRFNPIDSMVNKATIRVGLLQGRVVRNILDVQDQLNIVEQRSKVIRLNYLKRDQPPLWSLGSAGERKKVFAWHLFKSKLLIAYYLRGAAGGIVFVLLLFLAFWWLLRIMMNRLQTLHKDIVLQDFAPHIKRSAFLVSLFIVLSISQALAGNLPMVILQAAWIIMFLSASYLFWPSLDKVWKKVWIAFAILFLWSCFENLVAESSRPERLIMLLASLLGLLLCPYMLHMHQREENRVPYFGFFVWLFFIQEALALISNVTGVYTFARAMAVGGYFNFVIGLLFFRGVILLREVIVLSFEYYQRNDRISSMVNLQELKKNCEKFLPYIAWAGWLIIFAKNLNFYDIVVEAVSGFLTATRKLGSIEYSFGSVAIFFITIWISTLIAKVVTFLLSGNKSQVAAIKKTRFGSSILVLKLAIISLGVLIAFAASGIPMDKITIIIGALGVGIGFGLQNIVNNLVSGIILAFEKPIEIGDQIEIAGRLGKVKEIGIRSSRLATFEGAEVIIPNGDLLNQHVINWTLSNNHRRVEIIVGVGYGSKLPLAKEILEKVLLDNSKVDHIPMPLVLVNQFNSSSIDFRLLFWTDIGQWIELKSEIIMAIDTAFAEAGIEIPFPQIVIHHADEKEEAKNQIASEDANS